MTKERLDEATDIQRDIDHFQRELNELDRMEENKRIPAFFHCSGVSVSIPDHLKDDLIVLLRVAKNNQLSALEVEFAAP
ncbi:MAG: hypothetical protein ABFD82_18435 [Syntrophaceae bacterium]